MLYRQQCVETMARRLFEDAAGRLTVFPNDMEACLVLRAQGGHALAAAGFKLPGLTMLIQMTQ